MSRRVWFDDGEAIVPAGGAKCKPGNTKDTKDKEKGHEEERDEVAVDSNKPMRSYDRIP